jgi:ABC-2 type transport system ATP-binding protein
MQLARQVLTATSITNIKGGTAMIQVENLKRVYKKHGQTVGLLDASFTVPNGQIVGVLGVNGAGKTTLLRTMAGLLMPSGGTALFDGKPVCDVYARMSYITGEGSYISCLTVGEYGEFLRDVHPAFSQQRYDKFCEFLKLDKSDLISRMSTGQRSRIEVAAGFAKKADYYLLDEPFLGKDIFVRRDVLKLISATLDGGETILLTTHYIEDIDAFIDRAIIMNDGVIAKDIEMDEIRANGSSLVKEMANACGWNEESYLKFEE